ncbi:hypothetical protein VP193E371_P0043 [Vibrio phage 193E37-1]|nr:hypothetical protein VP193E371_P0043 [Vibrio phage 193E37-1]
MNKTQEILKWYRNCIATGSICCSTQSYYMKNYLIQYNEAIRMYNRERMDQMFPELERLSFPYVK